MSPLSPRPERLFLCFLKSVPLVGSGVGTDTLFQRDVPDAYRGRVIGAIGTSNALIGLASLWIASGLAEIVGIVPMLTVGCIVTVSARALGLRLLTGEAGTPRQSTDPQPVPQ